MKRILKVMALPVLAGLAVLFMVALSMARTGGVPAPTAATVGGDVDDKWCVGKSSGAELCVDGQSNFVPIQNEKLRLGSATLRFVTVYSSDLDASDDLSVSDDATITDDLTVNGDAFLGDAAADGVHVGGT